MVKLLDYVDVDIVMATYNGEKYIHEQIQSIQNQAFRNWRLIISDDGSQDNTTKIIREIAQYDDRIHLINTVKQGGVISNFNTALSYSNAHYIFLADQDDIWVDNRLNIMLEKFKELEKKDPDNGHMMFTDLELVDSDLKQISPSFYQYNSLDPYNNMKPYMLIWRSTVYGCSTIFNRNLLNQALPIPEYASMHDQWLALLAQKNESLFYYDFKSIKYRQHASNAVGGAGNSLVGKIKKTKKNFGSIKHNVKNIKKNLHINKFYPFSPYLFSFQIIFPSIIFGEKKIQTIILFLLFFII